jgi:transcriptional regulator of acetoin/glycerol metabolism
LRDAVQQGQFRSDLYARLAQLVVHVPPLRCRRQHILSLAREFAGGPIDIDADAAEALLRYDWPFNVRQLESVIAAFTALRSGKCLDLSYLVGRHPEMAPSTIASGDGGPPSESRRDMLERLLRKHKGNVTEAAKELGKPRAQLYRWLRGVGLRVDRFR